MSWIFSSFPSFSRIIFGFSWIHTNSFEFFRIVCYFFGFTQITVGFLEFYRLCSDYFEIYSVPCVVLRFCTTLLSCPNLTGFSLNLSDFGHILVFSAFVLDSSGFFRILPEFSWIISYSLVLFLILPNFHVFSDILSDFSKFSRILSISFGFFPILSYSGGIWLDSIVFFWILSDLDFFRIILYFLGIFAYSLDFVGLSHIIHDFFRRNCKSKIPEESILIS